MGQKQEVEWPSLAPYFDKEIYCYLLPIKENSYPQNLAWKEHLEGEDGSWT